MTDAESYDLSVTLDDRWFEMPVTPETDVAAWAAGAVGRALALRGLIETGGRRLVWEQLFAAEVDLVTADVDDERQVVAAYLLVPAADMVPVTVVSLQVMWVGPAGVGGAVDSAVVPPAQRYGAPQVDELATKAGPCVRVRQVLCQPAVGPSSAAGSDILRNAVVYIWDLPEHELVLVGSALFGSPADGAVYGEVVDDLAASVSLSAA